MSLEPLRDTHPTTDITMTATRALGVLATRLTDALTRARAATEPHRTLLPQDMLAGLDALLGDFAERRVRIAIYGEVKAGKSTLLNAIAGAALSPVAFDPLTSIPVRVTYGPETVWRIGDRQIGSVADLERAMREGIATGSAPPEVVVETDLDLLQLGGQVDLLDTPGLGTAAAFDTVSGDVLRSLDAVIVVVRYPALFTQFTRQLMAGLEADISKLFVVWNLDADCAELSESERSTHAETLRAHVAGANDLFLVDARAGFRAAEANDPRGIVASGLSGFIAALARFASSGAREIASLREAAKRGHEWLRAARESMQQRHASLEHLLADTRARLRAVQSAADADAAVARRQVADFEAAVHRIGEDAAAAVSKHAAVLRRALRAARRRWAHRPDMAALTAAIAQATARYADAVHSASQSATQAVGAAASGCSATVAITPRARTVPTIGPLTSQDRLALATQGGIQWLRRMTWQRWYLPGVVRLERDGTAADLAANAGWWNATAAAAHRAGAAALAARLAEIARRAETEQRRIESETSFTACETEFDALTKNLPVIAAQLDVIGQLSTEARGR